MEDKDLKGGCKFSLIFEKRLCAHHIIHDKVRKREKDRER